MWLFTKDGFFSTVEHRKNHIYVIVRARYREDLEKLRDKIGLQFQVESTPRADYPYRLVVLKSRWVEYVSKSAKEIDYDNFKDVVLKNASPVRNSQYHEVWSIMSYIPIEERCEMTFDEPLHRRGL